MDFEDCEIVYFDRRAHSDQVVEKDSPAFKVPNWNASSAGSEASPYASTLDALLAVFPAESCLGRVTSYKPTAPDDRPLIVIAHVECASSDNNTGAAQEKAIEAQPGIDEFRQLCVEIRSQRMADLILTVAVLDSCDEATAYDLIAQESPSAVSRKRSFSQTRPYFDAGAVEVLHAPITSDHVQGLVSHAYRTHATIHKDEPMFSERRRNSTWLGIARGAAICVLARGDGL
ncbi:hypothetical protein MRB53_039727 [Persea americana]|nr:hypothetical protein MRB53_039727 [Persea americana]